MSTQKRRYTVTEEVDVNIPRTREYDSEEEAELDRKLVDAIKAAAEADEEYLAGVLRNELGSHYYAAQ